MKNDNIIPIECFTEGVGTPVNPYAKYLPNKLISLEWKEFDVQNNRGIPAYMPDGVTPLSKGFKGDCCLQNQYYSNAGVWTNFSFSDDFYDNIKGYETRQIYLSTTPPPTSTIGETDASCGELKAPEVKDENCFNIVVNENTVGFYNDLKTKLEIGYKGDVFKSWQYKRFDDWVFPDFVKQSIFDAEPPEIEPSDFNKSTLETREAFISPNFPPDTPAKPFKAIDEGVKQRFYDKFDCYADTDNGLPIEAMTLNSVLETVEWALQQNTVGKVSVEDWISVEDRLPDARIRVNAWNENCVCDMYVDHGGNWHFTHSENVYCAEEKAKRTTHWMPLPQAPKSKT